MFGQAWLYSEPEWHKKLPEKLRGAYDLTMELDEEQSDRFFCQKEAAAGELYRQFLGANNSPETKHVKNFSSNKNRVWSEFIKNLIFWAGAYNEEENTIDDLPIQPNGSLKKISADGSVQYKKIKGLIAIGVAGEFLKELDFHDQNFGIVENEKSYRAKKFDHEGSLCFSPKDVFLDYGKIKHIFNKAEKLLHPFNEAIFPGEIATASGIYKEMYKIIQRILACDLEAVINDFIDEEFEEERVKIREVLLKRQQSLKSQAGQDPGYTFYLLMTGKKINSVDFRFPVGPYQGYTLMEYAIKKGNSEMILALLKNGADITLLLNLKKVSVSIHSELVFRYQQPKNKCELAIYDFIKTKERELAFEQPNSLRVMPKFGRFVELEQDPLHLYSLYHIDKFYLDVDSRMKDGPYEGYTLLEYAIACRNSPMVLTLLERRANVTTHRKDMGFSISAYDELVFSYRNPQNETELEICKRLKKIEKSLSSSSKDPVKEYGLSHFGFFQEWYKNNKKRVSFKRHANVDRDNVKKIRIHFQ